MPPTISETVGGLDALLAAFDPVDVELLVLPELPQAARPATSAATPAALAILMRVCLDIGTAPTGSGGGCCVLRSKALARPPGQPRGGASRAGFPLWQRPTGPPDPFLHAHHALVRPRPPRHDSAPAAHAA